MRLIEDRTPSVPRRFTKADPSKARTVTYKSRQTSCDFRKSTFSESQTILRALRLREYAQKEFLMNRTRDRLATRALMILCIACAAVSGTIFPVRSAQARAVNRGSALPARKHGRDEIVSGQLGTRLDEYLKRFEAVDFSGALLVVKDGHTVLQRGYGYADRSRRIRVTPTTVFDILSLTKQFTAAAILKLEMQGKLSVNDPLTKFFDNVPEDKRGITIHHLLTHSAGLARGFGDDYAEMSRDALVKRAFQSKLLSTPGQRYSYSNAGYSLLAAIIEIVSGQRYEHYLRENLFKPAGMSDTGYALPKWNPDRIAHGYRGDEDWGRPNDKPWAFDAPYWNLLGNGGILSTAQDMYRWHLALESDAVLSEEAKRKLFTPYITEDPDDPNWKGRYAYGWAIRPTERGTRLVTHTGRNPYFYSDFMRFVDEQVVIFFATNNVDFQALAAQIPPIVFGDKEPVQPPATIALSANRRARYTGTYRLPAGDEIIVSSSERGLRVRAGTQEGLSLVVPARPADRQTIERLNERAVRLIRAAADGDFHALHNQPDGNVLESLAGDWRDWLARWGKFTNFKLLGTYPRGKIDHTTVMRVDFEWRSLFLHYLWGQDAEIVLDAIITGSEPVTKIYPVSETAFSSYDMRLPSSYAVRVYFDDSAKGARSLTIESGERKIVARKISQAQN
jgi:CubicO group peptidase (beta-lactamase class C family)